MSASLSKSAPAQRTLAKNSVRPPAAAKRAPIRNGVTFTARDLNRQPAKVLNAVRKFGPVEIQTRNGETFIVSLKPAQKRKKSGIPDFEDLWRRQREAGCTPIPASENERFNRIIAGEE